MELILPAKIEEQFEGMGNMIDKNSRKGYSRSERALWRKRTLVGSSRRSD